MARNRKKNKRMTKEIYEYFKHRSKEAKFIMLHTHLLDFKSKEAVGQWIALGNGMEKMCEYQGNYCY